MRTIRYRHWLSGYNFAPAIDSDRMSALLRDVRAGEQSAINEMIEGHLRLATGMVARYASSKSVDLDELVSAAFYAVVYAVHRIAGGHMQHDNVGGYIAKFLHQFLHGALKGRSIISNPRGAEEPVMCCQLDDCNSSHAQAVPPDTSMEVEEAIESLASDDTDAKIVRMLRLGYAPADIARDLDIHKGNVSRRIHRIRQTYMELINE